MLRHLRALMTLILVALFPLAACEGGGASGADDGEGGGNANATGNGPNTGSGNEGGSTGSDQTTGGDACVPSADNPTCTGATSCTCEERHPWISDIPKGSDCTLDNGGEGNVCSPGGSNHCGCDLPSESDYTAPQCAGYVNGDTWSDENGTEAQFSSDPRYVYWSAQLKIGLGALLPLEASEAYYFDGFIVSGWKLFWNMANPDLPHCEGEFGPECTTITMTCWPGGATATDPEPFIYTHVHQEGM